MERVRMLVRSVSTWSPLATAFNSKTVQKINFSFNKDSVGLFGIKELRDPEGFYALKERAIVKSHALIEECRDPDRRRNMVDIFDELSDTLCQVADMAEFVRVAHPEPKFAFAAQDACLEISSLVEKLNTDRVLYNILRKSVLEGDVSPTDDVDKHVAKLFLFDFEQCGIHLDEKKRERVVHLNDCIMHLGSTFMKNCLEPRVIPKANLPPEIIHKFRSDSDNIIIQGLHADSPDERIREAAFKLYLYPDSHQEDMLASLLMARHELGILCGFPSFAHKALRGSLADDPANVGTFLLQLAENLRLPALKNFEYLAEAKNSDVKDLKPWDIPYYSSVVKNKMFNIEVSDYIPYLSLGACMEGLNNLFSNLYDVTFSLEDTAPGEIWNPDVHKIAVVHRTEKVLGYIYCDFFERSGKPLQDCHFTIRGGRKLSDGSYQLPIVALLLNIPAPKWNFPSLLTPSMVENLFHEMGHAMHSMLGRTKHQHVTGTRCATDFAEVPSVLMEHFATDPRVLSSFARHHSSGKVIPEKMLHKLCKSKHFLAASEMQLQVFYAALDQRYHLQPLDGKTTTEILAQVQNEYYSFPHVPNTAWQLRFNHLVGYAAKYYSYLMSRSVASMIWQQFFQDNPFNSRMGEKYRSEILAHGGGKPAKDLVESFVCQSVSPRMLADSLAKEVDRYEI